jgi:DeoR/GlpR family transcriptional regulator of sugar metabolism
MIPLAPLDVADIVVSDTALADEYRQMLEKHQVEVLLA